MLNDNLILIIAGPLSVDLLKLSRDSYDKNTNISQLTFQRPYRPIAFKRDNRDYSSVSA